MLIACAWCGEDIPPWVRQDSATRCCSKACRQKLARFRVAPAGAVADKPMTFCYADPPYPGLAWRYYKGEEVDHYKLVDELLVRFPDGWALSTASKSLDLVLSHVRALVAYHGKDAEDVRIGAWVKGSHPSKSYRARCAWEPLIVFGGRPVLRMPKDPLDDVLVWGGRQHSLPGALVGMKPPAFSEWMFRTLGAARGDELVDMFPGSGSVGKAWKLYTMDPSEVNSRTRKTSRLAGAQKGDRRK